MVSYQLPVINLLRSASSTSSVVKSIICVNPRSLRFLFLNKQTQSQNHLNTPKSLQDNHSSLKSQASGLKKRTQNEPNFPPSTPLLIKDRCPQGGVVIPHYPVKIGVYSRSFAVYVGSLWDNFGTFWHRFVAVSEHKNRQNHHFQPFNRVFRQR